MLYRSCYFVFLCFTLISCQKEIVFEKVIANVTIIDGSGAPGYLGYIGINADTIAYVGVGTVSSEQLIDASGLTAAPGFINMLSWANESLIEDGRSMGDLRQGVTLEVFGEGWSMGPLTPSMKREMKAQMGDITYDISWTTLNEYLEFLEEKGIAPNVASFIGATTLRIHTVGYEDRRPTEAELDSMRLLVRDAMKEGALGIGSSLIYAPAFYSDTDELIALCEVAAAYDGMYISHIRSEGDRVLESIDELIEIASKAGIRAEIYHLKQAGEKNWDKLDVVISKIDSARNAGLEISANMYNYTAGSTGLDASMPPWVQEGGYDDWAKRLKDPSIRARVLKEMKDPEPDWENLMLAAGSAEKMILVNFRNDSLKYLTGKTLAEVAAIRGKTPEETAIDLVVEDGSRVGTVYFLMHEENVKRQMLLPYMSFGSDAGSMAPEGVFLKSATHPRAYGNFSRLLGRYVRDEQVMPLEEAIRKLTHLPATHLKIRNRGLLKPGYFADIVLFDPAKINDKATFDDPHQLSEGVVHVFVNGVQALKNGTHTGEFSGRVVRGPGYEKAAKNTEDVVAGN